MILKKISILNYKNIREASLELSPKINCFIGHNGEGKTNLLDAVYYLSFCHSAYTAIDSQVICHDQDFFVLEGLYEDDALNPTTVYCGMKRGTKKHFKRNKKEYKRLSQHIGLIPLIFVSPGDTLLIEGGSEERRRLMDVVISQYDNTYIETLNSYNKALLQRNRLLKDLSFEPELAGTLEIWDSQLIRYGSELIRAREAFIEMLDPLTSAIHGEITSGKEKMRVSYEKNISVPDYEAAMKRAGAADRKLKTTTVGPHRDDIGFFVNEMDLRKFGSQGQQRTGALSLKLSEIELMKRASGDWPVLLLDDVLSELDTERQRHLLNAISRTQTVLTSTGMENLMEGHFRIDRKFRIMEGTAEEVLPEQSV